MFSGREATSKAVISTNLGVDEFNRRTPKVVSNSVVFKSGHDIVAFVPAPGTDNAASLNIRRISKDIEPYIQMLDNSSPEEIFAATYQHQY